MNTTIYLTRIKPA